MSNDVLTRVWKHSPQKGSALLLTVALADIMNDNGIGFPGEDYLKDRIRMSSKQTERLIKHLDTTGEIYRRIGLGRGNKTYYAVLTGLDQKSITKVLTQHAEYFEIDPSSAESIAIEIIDKRRQFVQTKGDKLTVLKEKRSQSSKSLEKATNQDVKGDMVERKTATTHEPSLSNTSNTNTFAETALAVPPAPADPKPIEPTGLDASIPSQELEPKEKSSAKKEKVPMPHADGG